MIDIYMPVQTPFGFTLPLLQLNLIAAIIGTLMWRVSGVLLANSLSSDHPIVKISTFTGYSILSGYMAVLLIYPNNAELAAVSDVGRIGTLFVAGAVYRFAGKNLLLAMFSGIAFFSVFMYI